MKNNQYTATPNWFKDATTSLTGSLVGLQVTNYYIQGGSSSGGTIDISQVWEALAADTSEQINKSHLTDALKDIGLEGDFVDLTSDLSITGIKNFINGLKISDKLINIVDGVLYLDCNVAVTGGLTVYAQGTQDVPSIWDGAPFDNVTIHYNEETGLIEVIGGTGGGVSNWEDLQGKPGWITDTAPNNNIFPNTANYWVTDNNKISNWDNAVSKAHEHANKATLDKIYEKDGVIYWDGSLAVTGGITAYALGDVEVSTIMDGVVVDGTTIKKENGKLVVIGGSGSSFDEAAMWATLSAATNEQINKSHLTDAFNGYATESWVEGKGYALQTSLDAVSTKLNDFLEGSDTDTIINKWKELEAFLAGMSETDNLAEILSNKADTSYVNDELAKYVTLATDQSISGAKTFTSLLTTAAITASGDISTPNVRTTDSVYINGIRLYKSADGTIKIDGNLLVTGGITAYSTGDEGGSSGGGGIDVDVLWEILGGTGTQQINVTHLTDALTWNNISNKPSWIGDTKPSYTWSEIGSKPTTLRGYGITDAYTKSDSDNRFVNVSGDTITGDLSTKRLTSTDLFIDTGDATLKIYSGYNPNVGYSDGNICFQTSFDRTDGQNHEYPTSYPSRCNILLQPRGGQVYIGINPNEGDPHYKLFVNGRIYSTVGFIKENSSDSYLLLGGGGHKAISDFMTRKDGAAPDNSDYGFGYWDGIGSYISFAASGLGGQLRAQGNTLYYRYISGGKPNAWQILAKITDNVASATKLQTARTIWGQSFDGTDNIEGNISNVGFINPLSDNTYNIGTPNNTFRNVYTTWLVGAIGRELILGANNSDHIWIKTNGNIGIGTNSPSQKLDVAGAMRVTGAVTLNNTLSVGSTSVFGNNVTLNGSESNNITTSYRDNGSITNIGESAASIRHSLNFQWYDTEWYIGNIRGGSSNSVGFGVVNGSTCYLRVNTDATRVYGNFLATGGVTCYSSDQRAKTVIEQISLSLKQIANAPTIRFKWNDWKIKDDGKTHIGGIAQYIQKLLPETVLEADDMLNMDYATTGYIFAVQTAKHLVKTDTEVERLKKRVKKLEKQLKQLGYEEANIMDD